MLFIKNSEGNKENIWHQIRQTHASRAEWAWALTRASGWAEWLYGPEQGAGFKARTTLGFLLLLPASSAVLPFCPSAIRGSNGKRKCLTLTNAIRHCEHKIDIDWNVTQKYAQLPPPPRRSTTTIAPPLPPWHEYTNGRHTHHCECVSPCGSVCALRRSPGQFF